MAFVFSTFTGVFSRPLSSTSTMPALVASSLAGLSLLLAMPPCGISALVLIAFVPLILAAQNQSFPTVTACGGLFGVAAYISIPYSVILWGPEALLLAMLVCALVFSALAVVTKLLAYLVAGRAWVIFPLAYALVQTVCEQVFSIPLLISITFPVDELNAEGLFTTVGAKGVDYLICTFNALVAALFCERKKLLITTSLLGLLAFATGINFLDSSATVHRRGSLQVAAVDGNVSATRMRSIPYSKSARSSIASELDTLTEQAIAMNPDLILWPEGGNGLANRQIVSRRAAFRKMADIGSYELLAGSKYFDGEWRAFNVVEHVVNGYFVDSIVKQNPVPIIEEAVTPGSGGIVDVQSVPLGIGVCFDVAFTEAIGRLVANRTEDGAQAIVILSNDSSFGYSALSSIHLRYASIAALESSREILFHSNTGPVVSIGTDGRIRSGYLNASKPQVSKHELQLYVGTNFYLRHPLAINALLLALIYFSLRKLEQQCNR